MKQLESLDLWKQANALARFAYRLTLARPLRDHYALANQIRRSAISVPSNIAEGYALGTTAQFIRALRISKGSAAELLCQLRLARDLKLAPATEADTVIALCERVIALVIGTIRALANRDRHSSPLTRGN
jgi:four helix bundle protein